METNKPSVEEMLHSRASPTSYDINRSSILKYMKKRPEAVVRSQKKYFEKPEIKDRLKEYNHEYGLWKKFLNNQIWLYEKKLFLNILIDL